MVHYVDISAAVHSRAGLGRYAESLVKALHNQYPGHWGLFYNRGPNTCPPAGLERLPTATVRAGYKPWRLAVLLGQLFGLGFDRLLPGADLYHATEHLLMPLHRVPTVLTVHDLIFRLFPAYHKRLNYVYLNLAVPLFCRRATAIIAISESTKGDLVRYYRIDPAKISVVYEAAAPHFRRPSQEQIDAARTRYGLPERFLLHVGTLEPRKNLVRLLEALDLLHTESLDMPLVLVGGKGWLYNELFQRLGKLELRGMVKWLGYVPDADLPVIYAAATVCVVPSIYEGFGLPVLEAMACGTPVACSHTSSLPEVGSNAVRYFDPFDVTSIAIALRELWRNDGLRETLSTQGLERAANFSWERTAAQTMAVYQRTLR